MSEQRLCPAGFPVDPDTQLCLHGDKGEQGAKGDRGEQGMSHQLRYSIVVLFVVIIVMAGSSLLLTSHEISQNNRKWCATISLLVSQRAPPGSASSNPSRAYEQKLSADFHDLRSRLGCGK